MIARIAGRGHSFKGAGLYYLHDKESQTTDRVDWTQTRNIPVNDPEAATKWMAYTAIHANELKQNAGVSMSGRKREKGVVYTFSLSWSPDETPDRKQMEKAADETLELLGLKDHESLMVAHNDTKHPHIHIICNLVNPNDGRMHDPDWGAKLKLSDWSLKHENDNGKIYCEQRVKNNKERKKGKQVRYQEPVHDLKAEIQELYRQSDSGASFVAALNENGYALTKGNRRRFVLVDDYGNIHSLSRQLDKEQRKTHLQKLSDLDHQNLPLAQTVAEKRKYFDRDKYAAEQEQKIIDAAIEKAKEEQAAERQERLRAKKKKQERIGREIKSKVTKTPEAKQPANDDKAHLRQLDREQAWDLYAFNKRAALEQELEEFYDRKKIVKEIATYERHLKRHDTAWGRKFGKYNEYSELIKAKKLSLENIDMRIAEQRSKLEKELDKTNPYKLKNQSGGQELNPTIDFEKERKQRELKDKNRPPDDRDNDRTYNFDR